MNKPQFVISLNDMRFHSRIGVFDEERRLGNDFRVDVQFCIDASGFCREQLETTVSYADVFEVVRSCMEKESLLLETVTQEIGESIKARWPQAEDVHVRIAKLTPPIPGFNGNCAVEYVF